MNYGDLVKQLASLVQPAGDVIPFRRQSIEPGMGLTEGAGRMGGNKGGYTPGTMEWYAERSALEQKVGDAVAKESALLGRPLDAYEQAVIRQKFAPK